MHVTTHIVDDRRGVTILWLALALAVGLGVVIGLANVPGEAAPVPMLAPDRAAIESERSAVTRGVYPVALAARPACSRRTVTERDAVRRGVYPTGLAAREFCVLLALNVRELDAIRGVRPARADDSDMSWSTDWQNFRGRH